jgi:hypothetical protein
MIKPREIRDWTSERDVTLSRKNEQRKALAEINVVVRRLPAPVSITGDGYAIHAQWKSVDGANDVQVDAAQLTITPHVVEAPLGQLPVSGGTSLVVTIPAGRRVHSLTLEELAIVLPPQTEKTILKSEADLQANGLKLAVSLATTGPLGPPQFTIPAVAAHGVMPKSFGGASFDHNVLTLPNVAATQIGLSLVKSSFPDDVTPQTPISVKTISGTAATLPSALTLKDDDGADVWGFPGELPESSRTVIDLRHAIEKTFKAKVQQGQPLTATLTLKGAAGEVRPELVAPAGAVVVSVSGIVTTELAGDAVPVALPTPLPGIDPSRAIADVTVKYHAMRLHDSIADAEPLSAGGAGGAIVGVDPVVRMLPPAALNGMTVAKIGIIGRAPIDCELVAQLFDVSSGAPSAPLTPPAVITLAPSDVIDTIWLDVPKHDPLSVPAAVSVRTNHGRFFWAANPDPLVRIAIDDPLPGERPVRIGGRTVSAPAAVETHVAAKTLDPLAFHARAPIATSNLFVTLDLSDLSLEFDR